MCATAVSGGCLVVVDAMRTLPITSLVLVMFCGAWVAWGAEEMAPLKLELPKALFEGTPEGVKSSNLEPSRTGSRPSLMVPKGVTNLAKGKTVTSSDALPVIGELTYATDGDKEGYDGCYFELGPGKQWVQINLGKSQSVFAIVLWHFHKKARVYRDVVVQVCDDVDFIKDVRTVFNNDHDNSSGLGVGKDKEYIETCEGKLIDAKGLKGRYVRCYSNGSTAGDGVNHYIEVEVYGK